MKRLPCWILLLLCAVIASPALQADTAPTRTLTFSNQCPYDVWLTAVGSNASNIPCSPSTTNAQGNCPSGNICYDKNANTNYCVAGTTKSTTFPISSTSDINLTPSGCASGNQVTDTGSPLWGQCTCNSASDCASGQVCSTVEKGIQQCYWGYDLPQGGKLAADTGTARTLQLKVKANSTDSGAVVSSGKFFVKLACDENGTCLSDNSKGAPASLVEFTFQNDNDWYDVSYINGVNAPMAMYPVTSTGNDYESSDPYRCQAAGGGSEIYGDINTFQTQNGLTPNKELEKFVCTNDYDTTLGTSKVGFNFVSQVRGKATSCTKNSECGTGQVCGLTLQNVTGNQTATQCGQRLGYWTYAQLCGANSSYRNDGLGIRCDQTADLAYALCKNQAGLSDTGPGRSCFNANTTSSGQTCCGYEAWAAADGTAQPLGPGDAAVQGVVTTTWSSAILPKLLPIKQGCYLAYSFQYDDPYSTFTCASKSGLNSVDYHVDLCPGGASAGINPPTQGACVPKVPNGYQAANFTAAPPSGITLKIQRCDASGTKCTQTLSPTPPSSPIYTAKKGSWTYLFTATNGANVTQSCKFEIPEKGCIQRLDVSGNCKTWQVATDGAWQNRAVQIPNF